MGVVDFDRAQEILGVSRDVLPDLYDYMSEHAGATEESLRLLYDAYGDRLAGLGAGLVQQVVAAADLGPGWAPWDRLAVAEVYSLDPRLVMSGQIIASLVSTVRNGVSPKELVKLLVATVRELIGVWTDLLTSVPVVGWIIDLVLGIGFGIWDLVEAHRRSQEFAAEIDAVPSPAPDQVLDQAMADKVLALCEGGDWTPIWLPRGSYPWECKLIRQGSQPFPSGRVVRPTGSTGALGVVPGSNTVSDSIIMAGYVDPEHPSLGWRILQSGDWLVIGKAAAAQAWSLLWGRGPAAITVDTDAIDLAWRDRIWTVVDTLDSRTLCDELNSEQRFAIKRFYLKQVGLKADATAPDVFSQSQPAIAMRALRERQEALLNSDVVAYVDAANAPAQLRARLEDARRKLLGVEALLCHLDLDLIPDPVYRAEAELRRAYLGKGCLFASGVQAPEVDPGPTGFGLARVKLPPPPPAAFPRPSSGARPVPSPPGRADSSSTSSGGDGGGAGLGVLAVAVLAGLFFALKK